MKVILLRHEKRGIDVGYYSSLTDEGIFDTIHLKYKLDKIHIDEIFCSPFVRTIQTIYPYAYKNNKKINLEYGLYEYLHNPYFLLTKWYYTYDDIPDNDLKEIVNMEYKSIVDGNDFVVLEDEINLEKRITKFFNNIINNPEYKNKTILLVSHQGVINKIKDLYFKKTDMGEHFPMGHFEIYHWVREPRFP